MTVSLTVGVVTYETDLGLLQSTLESLDTAVRFARQSGSLDSCRITVLDNGPGSGHAQLLRQVQAVASTSQAQIETRHTGHNLGYGAANNLAIQTSMAEYHLVLNPDVSLHEAALDTGLRYLDGRPDVVLLSPLAVDAMGQRQYLCKAHPNAWVLLLRGFAPRWLRDHFKAAMDEYEMRGKTHGGEYVGRFLASGCFMLTRTAALRQIGGFDPAYFMYFEDFDLSLRLQRHGSIAFVPTVKIVHTGGDAAGKGWRHRRWFARSALRFFSTHGWRKA